MEIVFLANLDGLEIYVTQHVALVGTVITVVISAQGIANTTLPVIT